MTQLFYTQHRRGIRAVLTLAHGAGAGSDSPFMEELSNAIAHHDIQVVRFNFPYMVRAKKEGGRRPPDRAPQLLVAFRDIVSEISKDRSDSIPLLIGGKSMGGRMATLLAAEDAPDVDAVCVFGYPFHPPGKPQTLRIDHLPQIPVPVLICQGTRDAFGARDEVASLDLGPAVSFHWAESGNHDLKPLKASGYSQTDHIEAAAQAVSDLVSQIGSD